MNKESANLYLVVYTYDRDKFHCETIQAVDLTKAYMEFVYSHEANIEIIEVSLIKRGDKYEKASNGN